MKFTVVEATVTKEHPDFKHGPMKTITLGLLDEAGTPVKAEWFAKAATPVPAPASTLEGDVEDGPYGKKFKKAQPANGYGGGGRQKDPGERRSIAMQASQKVAVDAVRIAVDCGAWKPESVSQAADAINAVARKLYLQVIDADNDRIKGT